MTFLDQLLKDIEPFMNKIVLCPLTNDELSQIQAKFPQNLPGYYLELLKKVGTRQDLVWGLNTRNQFT
ncbi:MAG: hypothetical protein AAFV80_02900, partial [Bacteroidota bacterium]